MFDIELCEPRGIFLVRFHGPLQESDFAALDRVGRANPDGRQFDCVFDLSDVEKIEIATDFISKRGELPQAYHDRERIYVVANDDLKLLTRLYAAYQASKGWRPPRIVDTLAEALQTLGVTRGDFRPFDLAGTDRL